MQRSSPQPIPARQVSPPPADPSIGLAQAIKPSSLPSSFSGKTYFFTAPSSLADSVLQFGRDVVQNVDEVFNQQKDETGKVYQKL